MCTVSFIKHENGFSLTSNRDEQSTRPTQAPKIYFENNKNIIYPKDEIAGGTWIATSDTEVSVCLLNGGFKIHKRALPYSRSRGQVLKERFEHDSNSSFCEEVDLYKVEPFTLLLIDHSKDIDFVELVWDGQQKHIRQVDTNLHHIWASSTLYNEQQVALRRQWFSEFIADKSRINFEDIINFHTGSYTKEKAYDLVMERNVELKTVSVSQINITNNTRTFKYFDFVNHSIHNLNLDLFCKPV